MKATVVSVAVIVGLAFIGLAALYWLTPTGDLPAFLPGFKPGSVKPHFNHGLGALIIGLAALALERNPFRLCRGLGVRRGHTRMP